MKTVSLDFGRALIDYSPTAQARQQGFGESQLHGAVVPWLEEEGANDASVLVELVGFGYGVVASDNRPARPTVVTQQLGSCG